MKRFSNFAGLFSITFILFISCGSSNDEIRQQEIKDSIQLEKDRIELLERANRLFNSDTIEQEDTPVNK